MDEILQFYIRNCTMMSSCLVRMRLIPECALTTNNMTGITI